MLGNAGFWVGVAFFLFFAILYYYGVPGQVTNQLDSRSKRIADELAEAQRLRQEAEALLQEYRTKRTAAEREAAEIVAAATEEAQRLARETQERMADFVNRRTAAAEAKIAQAEAQAANDVRAAAVDAAIKVSETVLRGEMAGKAGEELLTRSLAEVRSKLH